MGLLLGKALAFLGSKLGAYVVMGGLAAAIAAFAWYIWTDREALQLEVQAERAKVFVWSSGADSPRPLTLIKNNRGLWKATNWSSLTVGIRPPAAPLDDDL